MLRGLKSADKVLGVLQRGWKGLSCSDRSVLLECAVSVCSALFVLSLKLL